MFATADVVPIIAVLWPNSTCQDEGSAEGAWRHLDTNRRFVRARGQGE